MIKEDPTKTLSSMAKDMGSAALILSQLKELEFYDEIFKPEERCSIEKIAEKIPERKEFTENLIGIL